MTYEIGGNLASGKWQVATFFVPPNITRKGVVGGGRRLHTTVTGVGIAFSAMLGVVASRRGVGIAFSAMLGVGIAFSAMLGVVASRRGVGITLSAMLGVAASRRGWASLSALC